MVVRWWLLHVVVATLAMTVGACGGSPEPPPTTVAASTSMEAEAEPSPTPVVEVEPSPTPVVEIEPSPTPVVESKDAEAEASSAPVTDAGEADAIREVVFGYWEAFNAYDPDKALSYLEGEYRQEREDIVRDQISRMKPFRVKLGLTEESPPAIIGPDEREMYLNMTEPRGQRRIHMIARKVKVEWKLTRTEEVR